MKKLFFPILFAATLGLVGCGEASLSSGAVKSSLEGQGYSVQVFNKAESEAYIKGINYVVEIDSAIDAHKGEKEVILIFFCKNINDADAFVKENISVMNGYAERYTEEPKVGSHNNVAYCGSASAVAAAGIRI